MDLNVDAVHIQLIGLRGIKRKGLRAPTFMLSQKDSITVNPIPLRSPAASVVNRGSRAFSISEIPTPLSFTDIMTVQT